MVAIMQGYGISLRMGRARMRMLSLLLDCFAPARQYQDNAEISYRLLAEQQDEEYTEDFEQGVRVTVKRLAGGSPQVKRVQFSREVFSERQASLWWEENGVRVRQHYASTGN